MKNNYAYVLGHSEFYWSCQIINIKLAYDNCIMSCIFYILSEHQTQSKPEKRGEGSKSGNTHAAICSRMSKFWS